MSPNTKVYAVEVETAAPLTASISAGRPVVIRRTKTFIDGMGGDRVSEETWPLVKGLIAGTIVVTVAQVLRAPGLRVSITTHAAGGLTTLDVDLAREISALAATADAIVEALVPQGLEIAIDTIDADRIRPFWAAVLGYRDDHGTLVDPLRIGPAVWFQEMTEPRNERQRFHIDVSVSHDAAQARVNAAVAAGGTLVTDEFARSWWVLSDADGNEACVCTWQDRDH